MKDLKYALQTLPVEIYNLENQILNKNFESSYKEYDVKLLKKEVMAKIMEDKNKPEFKELLSNPDKRRVELLKRLRKIESYKVLMSTIMEMKKNLVKLKLKRDLKVRMHRSAVAITRITTNTDTK